MIKEVILTPVAEGELEKVTDYLFSEWNGQVAFNFIERFEKVCELLLTNHEIYPFK